MTVSIIIINYNTFQLTCNCIQSIILYTKNIQYEIILVDNNSSECLPELFLEKFPDVQLIINKKNGGFAQGNNLGIAHAKGDLILLLNSDTVLQENSIAIAAETLQKLHNVGVLGVRMTYPDGRIQHTARRFRTFGWEFLDLFRCFLWVLPYKKKATLMLGKYFKADFDTYCDWLNGAFFLLKRDVIQLMPEQKLDDRFFMYGEDHLWCYQIKMLGYQCFFTSATTITHINSGSTNTSKQFDLLKVMLHNELIILKERYGKTLNFLCVSSLYLTKEYSRMAIKWIILKVTGKLVR